MRFASLALLAACARPDDVVVICHNANCVGPRDPARDDTPEALADALAAGPALIDGVEIDLLWRDGRCVMAHDAEAASSDPLAAAATIADHVGAYERFHLLVELKRGSDPERIADCAIDVLDVVGAPGAPLSVIFESFEPGLLAALIARPRWPGRSRTGDVQIRLSATFSFPAPLGYSHTLADFGDVPLDVVDVHPRLTTGGDLALYRDLGLEIAFWAEATTTELLDVLDDADYVVTSDAPLVRGWLDR